MNNTRAVIENCVFYNDYPTGYQEVVGIELNGLTMVRTTEINRCSFIDLWKPIDINGALPRIAYNLFTDSEHSHIHIQAIPDKGTDGDTDNLSDATDPERPGYNKFKDTDSGDKVINDRDVQIKMEKNDWGTDDLNEIDAAIDGPADFEPILETGDSVLAGSLFVTVVDGVTAERILTATVDVQVSPFDPMTENESGVYSFAALTADTYSVTVTAEGYEAGTDIVTVGEGELVSIAIALGGGEPGAGGCGAGPSRVPYGRGDLIVVSIVLIWIGLLRRQTFNRI